MESPREPWTGKVAAASTDHAIGSAFRCAKAGKHLNLRVLPFDELNFFVEVI